MSSVSRPYTTHVMPCYRAHTPHTSCHAIGLIHHTRHAISIRVEMLRRSHGACACILSLRVHASLSQALGLGDTLDFSKLEGVMQDILTCNVQEVLCQLSYERRMCVAVICVKSLSRGASLSCVCACFASRICRTSPQASCSVRSHNVFVLPCLATAMWCFVFHVLYVT